MDTKEIFREIDEIHTHLETRTRLVAGTFTDIIKECESILIYLDVAISNVKSLIAAHHFDSVGDEVFFFKTLKPKFISKFIYYSSILHLESRKPKSSNKMIRKYYEAELDKLKYFYEHNAEFYSYFNKDATYLDHKYFVRNSYDLKMKLSSGFYNYDRNFTTSHDHYISQILSSGYLELYLTKKIAEFSQSTVEKVSFNLKWTASKAGLIELIYGLHRMNCFNGGNVDLSEIVRFSEQSFQIDLGNFHKTIFEIRNRKQGSTKFLSLVAENLQQYFEKMDEE